MRIFTLFILLTLLQLQASGQQIRYNVPEGYESGISAADYKTIVDISVPIVAARFAIDSLGDGTMMLKAGQDLQAVNLHNLITKCIGVSDKSRWPQLIREHFENSFLAVDAQKEIDPTDYNAMKKDFSIRIYPQETIDARGGTGALVTRVDLEGTCTMLMLDLPGAFMPVQRSVFELWKKEEKEVFRIAQENVNLQPVEKASRSFEVNGSAIHLSFLGNEDYAASYALDLAGNSPELVGEWGAVVAIPNKGLVDICKVSREKPVDFVNFIQLTREMVQKAFGEHPQPVSPDYFWYYKGTFTRIAVITDRDGNVKVISPAGLTALMTE